MLVEFQGGIDVKVTTKISTPEQFMNFLESARNYEGEKVELTNDIDMSGYSNVEALSVSFAGIFDGNGYTISNINMNTTKRAGIFYGIETEGVVKNLNVEKDI